MLKDFFKYTEVQTLTIQYSYVAAEVQAQNTNKKWIQAYTTINTSLHGKTDKWEKFFPARTDTN